MSNLGFGHISFVVLYRRNGVKTFITEDMKQRIIAVVLGAATFTSCIKDEASNAECDIVGVDSLWIKQHRSMLIGEPVITNDHVSFSIQKGTDRSSLSPSFYLTPGASLTMADGGMEVPANGVARDFSTPCVYTTHSEDGLWSKAYTVSFNYPQPITTCSFEHYELDKSGRYYTWYEVDPADADNPRRDYWASGNAGFALTGMGHAPGDYPTSPLASGVKGNGVRLVTRATGSFGDGVNMPIAAGNLFIGQFNAAQAMIFPLKATRFGLQLVSGKPLYLEGWYKYTAGKEFTDKYKEVAPGRRDTCDIYAVLYEADPENFTQLNGADVLSSDRIACMARIENPGEPAEWQHFREPFRPLHGKRFDEQRLRTDGYAIAIVATSSRAGAFFEGAVGSVLCVDELRIVWEGEDE